MTALAGLPLYVELAEVAGLPASIRRHLRVAGSEGWGDVQVPLAMVFLQLAGGEAVADLRKLEHDAGFTAALRQLEGSGRGVPGRQRLPHAGTRRASRWRQPRTRIVPSPSAVLWYLTACHDASGAPARQGRVVIPPPTAGVQGLRQVSGDLVAWVHRCRPRRVATLDQYATLIESHKQQAHTRKRVPGYQHYPAYLPLNTYLAKQGTMPHTQCRDGNVPAGHEQLRVLQAALAMLPPGVAAVGCTHLRVDRSDTAG